MLGRVTKNRRQAGDTIIEVVLAFAVFSMVSVGAMTVMGQGTNSAQRALEITLVRQQIDAQAEALRAAQQAYTSFSDNDDSEWRKIARASDADDSAIFADAAACPVNVGQIPRSFIMDPRNASLVTDAAWFQDIGSKLDAPYAQVETTSGVRSFGMWIERDFEAGNTVTDAFDFKVRACWYAAGMQIPMQIETVVRLYEPGV